MNAKINKKRWTLHGIILAALTAFAIAYQSCGPSPGRTPPAPSKAKMGGEGYGGRVYAIQDDCGAGRVEVKSQIEIDKNGNITQTKEDCARLPTPRPIPAADVKISTLNPDLIVYADALFDQVTTSDPSQKIKTTDVHCSDVENQLEVTVWYYQDPVTPERPDEYFAQVKRIDGLMTGVIDVAKTAGRINYVDYNAVDSSVFFSLNVLTVMGSSELSYELDGTAYPDQSVRFCTRRL